MWFVFAFGLFSFMGTKFHHYIFPAVPPIGMLIGLVLNDMLGEGPIFALKVDAKHPRLPYFALVVSGLALMVVGVSMSFPGSVLGTKVAGDNAAPAYAISAALCAVGVGLLVVAVWRYKTALAQPMAHLAFGGDDPYRPGAMMVEAPAATPPEAQAKREDDHLQLMFSAATVAGALILGIVGRDLIIKPDNSSEPGAARLLQLFTYRYDRAWPDSLDFSAILTGFTFIGVALGFALAIRRFRKHTIVALLAFGMVWAAWGADVYMVKTAPHWGQRELLAAYYTDRSGPNEPVVAYQMNWKGENFYSSNQIPAFVSSGSTFTTWIKGQREKGVHVIYFITEHGRIGGLKGEVQGKSYREITDKTVNNKFVLVRAEI